MYKNTFMLNHQEDYNATKLTINVRVIFLLKKKKKLWKAREKLAHK